VTVREDNIPGSSRCFWGAVCTLMDALGVEDVYFGTLKV
jgi:hypothetical protein